jgi:hypothetical protein
MYNERSEYIISASAALAEVQRIGFNKIWEYIITNNILHLIRSNKKMGEMEYLRLEARLIRVTKKINMAEEEINALKEILLDKYYKFSLSSESILLWIEGIKSRKIALNIIDKYPVVIQGVCIYPPVNDDSFVTR